jgi:GTP cyclohydrolase IA
MLSIMATENQTWGNHYSKLDQYREGSLERLSALYKEIITGIGEDVERNGLCDSPERVAKAMLFLTQGYKMDPVKILESAIFDEKHNEMVMVKDIDLYSMCEHHLLPFFGRVHIAYIPNNKIVGLSKLARIVDVFGRRLQVQERLTTQILNCVHDTLNPLGAAVVIEAQHLCMMMRGTQKQNSVTTTSAFRGEFEKEPTRSEFINLISAKLI